MEYYGQTSLDEYYTLDENLEEETVDGVEEEPIEESSGRMDAWRFLIRVREVLMIILQT